GGFTNIGPWLAHIGFIVMLAGVVITSRFNTTRSFQKVEVGQAVTALGRQFIYRGQRPAAGPADRDRLLIDMVVNGKTTHLDPKLFVSKISEQTMAWPQIMHEWIGGAWGDVYVEPSGVDNTNVIKIEGVKKNDEKATGTHVQHRSSDPEDELAIRFLGLDTSEMQKQMQQKGGEPKPFTVYANALLYINGTEREIRPALRIVPTTQGIRTDPIPMRVEGLRQGTGYSLLFKDTNMEPGNLDASFELVPDEAVPQGYFQVLHVPGIQVLWWGCYLMIAGAFVSWLRRRNLAGRTPPSIPSSRKGAPAVEQGTPTEPAAERKPELAGARAQATTPRRKATQGEA
ncbi:MAG TPA: hypothetical protein VK689_11605, partial [Armatimonadota bacterium]|nr:hypothetical protein [Armatimonadota bacterium]